MRLKNCEQIWHGFRVHHRHLLLMMVFYCPLAFRHKKGEYIWDVFDTCTCFCFQGERFIFCWLEFVELFRLYLGTSLCTLPFLALAIFVLPCWVTHDRGSIFCCFLFQTAYWFMFMSTSLIYIFIVCCLKSRFYFSLLVFFSTHVVMHFV